ncbi:hypothetical protein P4S72_07345 [Vibrio sp. PP-XX7]
MYSPISVPPFDNSAMDGYAIRLTDLTSGHYFLSRENLLRVSHSKANGLGTFIRIMTGAAVPEGCDAVIMQEKAEIVDDDNIGFSAADVRAQENIRPMGDDLQQGELVFPQGHD